MTLSVLMYALMVYAVAMLAGMLVIDAVRSRVPKSRPVRIAAPAPRYGVGRVQHD